MNVKDNKIPPVPEGTKRPLWSVMIPTYNPDKYIYDAIESVLGQNIPPEKMQIEIVDDCSNKVDVEKIVNENWKGRVHYYKLPQNVGHSFNFTESVRRAKGELIHILHHDDMVLPGFYDTFESIFEQYENIGAAFCRQRYIDEEGKLLFRSEPELEHRGLLQDAVVKLAQMQRIQYCAMVVRRKVYEQLGGFVMKNIGCEDWEMWVRIASEFPVAYEPNDLAEYRVHHETSMTLKDMRSGEDMRAMREAISIFRQYVPKDKRKETDLFRNIHYGEYSFRNGYKLLMEHKDEEGAAAQWNETIMFDPEVVFENFKLVKDISYPIHNAGVSVIADCRCDEKIYSETIMHLVRQEVPAFIPWEIILFTNENGRDKLSLKFKKLLERKKIKFRIVECEDCDRLHYIDKAAETAEYNFIVFCGIGEYPDKRYVAFASRNMLRDRRLAALSGYTEGLFENRVFPDWNGKWNEMYEIGEQFDYTNVLTWQKGYVWDSGMVLRKEAWKDLMKRNFNIQTETHNNLSSEFRCRLGRAFKESGWNLWYSTDLRLTKLISSNEFKWSSIKERWKNSKLDESLSKYITVDSRNTRSDLTDSEQTPIRIKHTLSGKKSIEDTYRRLSRYKRWKLRSYREINRYDEDILNINFLFELLKIQLGGIASYNRKVRLLKRISGKRDLRLLRRAVSEKYFRYPQYRNGRTRRGISVMLEFNNSSYHYLVRALDYLSKQNVPEDFPWEVNIVSNFIKDDLKRELISIWKKSDAGAGLNFYDQYKQENYFAANSVTQCRYDNLILMNEFDMLQSDFVRMSFRIISDDKDAVIAGGQTMEASEVKLPKWFKEHKELFGVGKLGDYPEDITHEHKDLWKSGIVVKKTFLKEIAGDIERSRFKDFETSGRKEKILSQAARKSGKKILYNPRLISGLLVPVEKLNWEYLRKLHYADGASKVLESLHENDSALVPWTMSLNRTIGQLKNYPLKKIFLNRSAGNSDTETLEIESLKGRFSGLLKTRGQYTRVLSEVSGRSNGNSNGSKIVNGKKLDKGISIIICCYNSSRVIEDTLRYICRQEVPKDIPWEVVIIDNASTDDTGAIAKQYWLNHNCLVPLRVVRENKPGLTVARMKGINSAKYEYIIFCDDDNRLSKDFVGKSYQLMEKNEDAGILGGRSKAVFEVEPPGWFDFWKDSYAIGAQSKEKSSDVTDSRGYLWGAAMVVRKSAMKKLLAKGFQSILADRKGNVLSAGGDTEICYALRNEGWKMRYESELTFKHYITSDRLNWDYLGRLFKGFGQASIGLDLYIRKYISATRSDVRKRRIDLRSDLRRTLHRIRKTNYEKLLMKNLSLEGDTDIPMLEYCLGRIEGLLKKKKSYNRALHFLKKTARKNDIRILTPSFRDNYKIFPRYKFEKKFNGVSVIVCTYNGAARLPDTIRHLALQKVRKDILWEVILVDNASTDNSKEAVINEWKKHKPAAKLRIVDQPIPGKQLALEKGYEVANYEYLITCDDDNWLEENFVQYVFEVMHNNQHIGVLGGPNNALCEVEPPDWFKYFQKDYAAGEQGDIYTGSVSRGNITWKRGFVWGAGMVVRKSAWEKLILDGFRTSMSCRKGEELTSGGDSEACYALVLAGWQVWYDPRLKLKHCMPAGRLEWDYLIRLFKGFGVASVGLEIYEKAIKLGRADVDHKEIENQDWWYEVKRTIREIRKYGIKKILSLRLPQKDNTDIVMLEFYLTRLQELFRVRKEYNVKYKQLQNAPWKKGYADLRRSHRESVEKEIDIRYGWPWSIESGTVPPENSERKKFPKISVLTPSFNSSGTIEKAIMSVVMQNYPDVEHIICDGGSKDNTVEILKKYPHLKWISEKDKGQSDAMNKAFAMSNGDIIVYLNADDYFQRGAFYKIAEAFDKNPAADMIVGNLLFDYVDHTFIRKPEIDYKKIMQPFKYMFPINPVSYFYKRKMQEEIGAFPLDNHMTMDYWFLLKAYQSYKLVKIEDYLGTFFMNGLNKTSTADNRKNTHDRVVYHCRHYDKKLLPFYLYNYYKFFYYEKKPYNLSKIAHGLKKNSRRALSLLTLKKNKYYSEKVYLRGRYRFFENKKLRAAMFIMLSYVINPKALKKRVRMNMLLQSLLWNNGYEGLMNAYRFFAYPPGMTLAHKLQFYGNEFKNSGKKTKGSLLLMLAVLFAPAQNLRIKKKTKTPVYSYNKSISLFNADRRKEVSYANFTKAQEKYYYHKNFQAVSLLLWSFFLNPRTTFKKSRINFLIYALLGKSNTDKIKLIYHFLKDNPELSLPHKLNYYGNKLKDENHPFKGNAILLLTYILSPKYIPKKTKRKKSKTIPVKVEPEKSKIIYASEITVPENYLSPKNAGQGNGLRKLKSYVRYDMNPVTKSKNFVSRTSYGFKSAYHYFRYRKFKARSKDLYAEAIESFGRNQRFRTFTLLMKSYLLYPPSVVKKNKLSLAVNSFFGNSIVGKFKNVFK